MHDLANVLKSFSNFTDSELQQILLPFNPVKIKKGNLILKEGEVNENLWFLNSGCCMLLNNTKHKGKIIKIYEPGFFMVEIRSFLTLMPSQFDIKTITDVELLVLHRSDLEALKKFSAKWEIFMYKLVENICLYLAGELVDSKMLSKEERYHKLLNNNSFLFQLVPLYIIANYLDMTPVGLSKLRSRLNASHNYGFIG